MKYEKTQSGNPHKLTIKQHTIPRRTIERFAGDDGRVEIRLGASGPTQRLKPNADVFCVRRAWDQRAEHGYMKSIEDDFQPLADRIASGELNEIPEAALSAVNMFYALWFHRSRVQPAEELFMHLNGITGDMLTKDQQEVIEAKHGMCARPGGLFPMRHITGFQLQKSLDFQNFSVNSWGVIYATEGEFVVPDVPVHGLMPITPTILLAADQPSGFITKANLIQINIGFLAYTRRYFFGKNLGVALDGGTDAAFQDALRDRDKKIAQGLVV